MECECLLAVHTVACLPSVSLVAGDRCLRNMPLVRAHVREGMADLAAQMDVLAGDRISRKFRFAEE